jgi:hypothetical protein
LFAGAVTAGKVTALILQDPKVEEELDYHRKVAESEGASTKMDSRVFDSIPEFRGDSELEWRRFERCWLVAVRNHGMTESNLLTALIPRLKGTAQTFYMSLREGAEMSFGQLMQALRTRYASDRMNAQNRIVGITQGSKESVNDYYARLQVAAAALYPPTPCELKVAVVEGSSYIMPNPIKGDEKAEYNALVRLAETTILRHFLVGLRPEVQEKLPTAKYERLDQAVEAARDAEWMYGSMSGMLHNLTAHSTHAIDQEECYTTTATGRRSMGPQCYGCQEYGHIRRNCPKEKSQGAQQSTQQSSGKTWSQPRPLQAQRVGSGVSGRRSVGKPVERRNAYSKPSLPGDLRSHLKTVPFGRHLVRDPRKVSTKGWMVRNRARFDTRRRLERQLYSIQGSDFNEEIDENDLNDDEKLLFSLENELSEGEFKEYSDEVFEALESVEEEVEAIQHGNSKNY